MSTFKAMLDGLGRALFWFAFIAFMLASIPHTAYFFRAWEPTVTPTDNRDDLAYWGVAYAIAISVDGMVIYLTRALTVLNKQGGKRFAKGVAWLGIGLLSLLSWFVNWQYAIQFRGHMLDRVLSLSLGWWKLADIDPILASMFQALIIFYTFISDKVHEPPIERQEEDLAELRKRAAEADERAQLQTSIHAAKQQQRAERAKSLLQLGKAVVGEMRHTPEEESMLERALQLFREMPHLLEEHNAPLADTLLKQHLKVHKREEAQLWRMRAVSILTQEDRDAERQAGSTAGQGTQEVEHDVLEETEQAALPRDGGATEQTAEGDGTDREGSTEQSREVISPGKMVPHGISNGTGPGRSSPQRNAPQPGPSTDDADPSTGRRTLTVKEVAGITGYSEKYVRDLRHKGVLKTAPRNKQLILLSSVNALVKARQNQMQKRAVSPVDTQDSA
jgi:hypothetical protein